MTEFSKTRRRLLQGTAAWFGGGIVALATANSGRAAMQHVELKPTSPLGTAVANRCQTAAADHADIRERLLMELAADPSRISLSERCPICGCPVVVTR